MSASGAVPLTTERNHALDLSRQTDTTTLATSTAQEAKQALSALDARETPQGILIVLPERVLFAFEKAELQPSAAAPLDEIAKVLGFDAKRNATVTGYTDSKGAPAFNLDLSQRRAQAVADALRGPRHVDGTRLQVSGKGKLNPVAPNTRPDGSDNPAGRAQNRRVEVVVLP